MEPLNWNNFNQIGMFFILSIHVLAYGYSKLKRKVSNDCNNEETRNNIVHHFN